MTALPNAPFWYVGYSKWAAITPRPFTTAIPVGRLAIYETGVVVTPGDERVWVCVVAGTSGGSFVTWNLGKGSTTTDGAVTWMECTGQPAVNGDVTNTQDWNAAKNKSVNVGQIIKRNSAASYQICTTAGTTSNGTEPAFSDTAGVTTTDGSVTWTSLGAVGNFSAWGAPHARLYKAMSSAWGSAGDTFYVSNNHAETVADNMGISFPGTSNTDLAQTKVLCVTDTAAPPTTINTTASVTTTSNSSAMTFGGNYSYTYGITFNCNSALAIQSLAPVFENCGFNLTANATKTMTIGANGFFPMKHVYKNCTFGFANSNQSIIFDSGTYDIIGGSMALTGTVPSTLLQGSSIAGVTRIRDCDLSAVTGNLLDVSNIGNHDFILSNCKLGTGVTPAANSIIGEGAVSLRLHNCDSTTTNYRMYNCFYEGISQQSTTVYNNAGATDGTTPISWKIDTNSGTKPAFGLPYVTEEIFQWVDTTGSALTATVEIAGASSLNNDDIWMEIEYLGNASYPLGSTVDCRKADYMSTNAAVTSSSASWTGSPAVTQKLQVTFTPQMKGPIKARIYVAKQSCTVYVDPLITVA